MIDKQCFQCPTDDCSINIAAWKIPWNGFSRNFLKISCEIDFAIFLFMYSDDEDEDEDDQFAVAATFGSSLNLFKTPKTSPVKPSSSTTTPMGSNKTQQQNPQKMMQGPSQQNVDKERLTVDISALRQQYRKLRQRQQQAHIILTCK